MGQARRVRRIEQRPQRGYIATGEKGNLARGTDELGPTERGTCQERESK